MWIPGKYKLLQFIVLTFNDGTWLLDGIIVGIIVGDSEGDKEGLLEGNEDGWLVDGIIVGIIVGDCEGDKEGLLEGNEEGLLVGLNEGEGDGGVLGKSVISLHTVYFTDPLKMLFGIVD
eukprot:CAMPEP_0113315774 /NCGR_PEP_ID=MMETSP0010_2-20120614/11310_1 /TAXON_ID=216773 ORGANISM="Corethron hystrix, Strain 308" /NCGR_SAMPLE_ID=MMETSP0010_2 /ASSEMBLY_ACC=CAM_ASM_000155 /LENGTH=118 /DNA_ID=CAMNT_0000172347 /DNA_START=913 /DNA_END=1270 /DNA_ORIENTATION=- /assembly_acc=CAM_ASM_000155